MHFIVTHSDICPKFCKKKTKVGGFVYAFPM